MPCRESIGIYWLADFWKQRNREKILRRCFLENRVVSCQSAKNPFSTLPTFSLFDIYGWKYIYTSWESSFHESLVPRLRNLSASFHSRFSALHRSIFIHRGTREIRAHRYCLFMSWGIIRDFGDYWPNATTPNEGNVLHFSKLVFMGKW